MKNTISIINGVIIQNELFSAPFSCDLIKCKGACCTIKSDLGAPLNKEEIPQIEEVYKEALPLLPAEHRKMIEKDGFWEEVDGYLYTKSYNERACVFVYYDGEIARCALEKNYFDGKTAFRKPISCHLYPIRINDFGGDALRYHKMDECAPARSRGRDVRTTVYEFSRDSLTRKYGSDWVEAVDAYLESSNDNSKKA